MPIGRWSRRASLRGALIVFAVALFAVLFNTTAPPHTHASATPGIFNEDHDLSAFATLGTTTGLLSRAPSVEALVDVAPLADGPREASLRDDAHRASGSRAPPLF
jgi:hypothetical protein